MGERRSQGMSCGCRKTISRLLTRTVTTARALTTRRAPTRRTLLTPMIAHFIENTRTWKTRTRRTFSSLTDAQLVRSTQTISRGIKPWIHAHSAISIGFPRPVKTKCVVKFQAGLLTTRTDAHPNGSTNKKDTNK